MRPLSLSRLYYLCDPAVPVVGGPLMRGYETILAGSVHQGKHIIAEYLASQYKIRHEERCTADFVPAAKLARREGIDFVLDPMWRQVPPGLNEHIDGLRSTCPRPKPLTRE